MKKIERDYQKSMDWPCNLSEWENGHLWKLPPSKCEHIDCEGYDLIDSSGKRTPTGLWTWNLWAVSPFVENQPRELEKIEPPLRKKYYLNVR
jgi:hypothetical protein